MTPVYELILSHQQNRGSSKSIRESKIEKVPRGIRGEKSSKDMASSRNLVSTIGALASPKMGDRIIRSSTVHIARYSQAPAL